MSDISKALQATLIDTFDNTLPEVIDIQTSKDHTSKFLLKLSDANCIEMVYIPAEKKNTLCISTQVGCARRCSFCATAKIGLKRNLTQAEILAQILIAQNHFPEKKITNLVFMGMGEPLDNFDNVVSALQIIQDKDGFYFSGRRITISTAGVVPKIYELADIFSSKTNIKIKLAISLNAAIDEKRDKIMPINLIYPLSELKKAVQYFRKHTHFRITFEYIMMSNFNMQTEDIKALTKFCSDISCKINLIRWNEIPDYPYQSPTDDEVDTFIQQLHKIPNAITIRKSRGADIAGACGQLAGKAI